MLSVKGVSKGYGGQLVLDNISLDIQEGEFLAIMGANGAGKSTLLKILALLLRPSTGRLLYKGMEVTRDRESYYRKSLGFLGHNSFLYEELTAWDNLMFYGQLYGVNDIERRIEEWLDHIRLIGFARDPVKVFSRGMQQRLALCRVLLLQPDVLLLDEPYTGLDGNGQVLLDSILKNFRKTVVMVSHDLGKSKELADRIVFIEEGRLNGLDGRIL